MTLQTLVAKGTLPQLQRAVINMGGLRRGATAPIENYAYASVPVISSGRTQASKSSGER